MIDQYIDDITVWETIRDHVQTGEVTNARRQERRFNEQYIDDARRSVSDLRTLVRLAVEVKL